MIKQNGVIVIAAGGTGGHIFPAIATGREIESLRPDVKIIYACGERPLEVGLYQKNGIEPHIFPARQLRGGVIGKLGGVAAAAGNIARAASWLRAVKADAVIGFGGYVAGPTVLAGKLIGCRTAIHEANSVPGKTNRILGRWMDLTAVHFASTSKHLGGKKTLVTGMPIRELKPAATREEARRAVGLEPGLTTLLIVGGSQGAKFLYQQIAELLPQLDKRVKRPVQVLWSTGENNFSELKERLEPLELDNIDVRLVPFISDMANAIYAADVAIARSGASALAELVSLNTFALYVPFPGAIYDHQTLNAREAEKAGLGIVIPESALRERLLDELTALLNDTGDRTANPARSDTMPAARQMAEAVLAL